MTDKNPFSFIPCSMVVRLIIFVGLTAVLIFLCFGLYIEHTAKTHFVEMDMSELGLSVAAVQDTLQDVKDRDDIAQALSPVISAHPNIFIYLEDKNAQTLYLSEKDNGALIALILKNARSNADMPQVWNDGQNDYRILISTFTDDKFAAKIITGMNINFHQHYIRHFRMSLWLSALIACFITVFVSFLVIYFSFKPVKTISEKIKEITSERLNTRIDEKAAPDEFKSLIRSFNTMIENIEDVFKRQSNFSADIAHELRTPISSLITQTQIILNKTRDANEYREILYSNLEEFERMSKMINDMLFLSRCEKESITKDEVDLRRQTSALVEYFGILAEEKGVQITLDGDAPLIYGNKDMIKRCLSNLLSNAINYAKENSEISIRLSKEANQSVLKISNISTLALTKENIERIFDRFYRLDNARNRKSGGSGIGLAIVKSIVSAHKGEIFVDYQEGVVAFVVKFHSHFLSS